MFHNVVDLKAVLTDMMAEGQMVAELQVSRLSLYRREHIRRFGQYVLGMDEELPTTLSSSPKIGPETSL